MKDYPTSRDWVVFLVIALLVGVASVAMASAPEPKKGKPVSIGCDVIVHNDEDTQVILKIKKKDVIKKLVDEPLLAAKKDPDPAAYVVLGLLKLRKDDGSEETVELFQPWGRIKRGETYFICELKGLRKLVKERLKLATARTESE
jgi:hypothetical protein